MIHAAHQLGLAILVFICLLCWFVSMVEKKKLTPEMETSIIFIAGLLSLAFFLLTL